MSFGPLGAKSPPTQMKGFRMQMRRERLHRRSFNLFGKNVCSDEYYYSYMISYNVFKAFIYLIYGITKVYYASYNLR